jgi:hypothetical protein
MTTKAKKHKKTIIKDLLNVVLVNAVIMKVYAAAKCE